MTNAAALTAELIAELDALPDGATVYADPNVPGLAWQLWTGEGDYRYCQSGPVGAPIDYDRDEDGHGFRAAQDQARELLDEVERAGYPVGR